MRLEIHHWTSHQNMIVFSYIFKRWVNIFAVTEEELVSSDILGSHYGSIADLKMTRVVGGNLVKVMGWYDNEMGYTYTLVDHVIKTGNTIK